MSNPYSILGVTKNSSEEEIKKAYRKLAMEHHPDRQGGDETKFKEIKNAYETISDPNKKEAFDNPRGHNQSFNSMDELMEAMRRRAHTAQVPEISAIVSIKEAFKGVTLNVKINGINDSVDIPAGVPNMSRGQYETKGGKPIIVGVKFAETEFRTPTIDEAQYETSNDGVHLSGNLNTGDVQISLKVDALDLILGAWVKVKDILGDSYSIRIPSGFDTSSRLKVSKKGYLNWSMRNNAASQERADMYVSVIPIFSQIKKLDREKVKALYDLVNQEDKIENKDTQ